jgi:hypothetical protein
VIEHCLYRTFLRGQVHPGDYFLKQGHPVLSDDKVATYLQDRHYYAVPLMTFDVRAARRSGVELVNKATPRSTSTAICSPA